MFFEHSGEGCARGGCSSRSSLEQAVNTSDDKTDAMTDAINNQRDIALLYDTSVTFAAPPQTTPLNGSAWAMLREQVATIQAVLRKRYGGATLDQSRADLALLQKILDDGLYDDTNRDELRAMGTVFGNVLEKQLAFEWVAAQTARDEEPALRLKTDNSLVIFPLRMIFDAVVNGARVDLTHMYRVVEGDVKATRKL